MSIYYTILYIVYNVKEKHYKMLVDRLKYSKKPATEVLLYELQEKYLKSRDISIYQQIFSEILPYARSMILKRTRGKIYLHPELVDSYALDSTIKFMSQYEDPEFEGIHTSFAGILGYKVLESMYGPKVVASDAIISLNEHIENFKDKETELGDMPESLNFTYMFRPDGATVNDDPANYLFNKESDAIDSILSIVRDLYFSTSLYVYLMVSLGLLHFIKKSRVYDKYRELVLDDQCREALDLCILEMHKRLENRV
jgi:hypothetical protein